MLQWCLAQHPRWLLWKSEQKPDKFPLRLRQQSPSGMLQTNLNLYLSPLPLVATFEVVLSIRKSIWQAFRSWSLLFIACILLIKRVALTAVVVNDRRLELFKIFGN